MPAWCPPVAPVGPWRPVTIESAGSLRVEQADVRVELDGDDGIVRVSILATPAAANVGEHGRLREHGTFAVGERTAPVAFERAPDGGVALHAVVRVPDADRWWPHTHGRQPLYPVRLVIDSHGEALTIDLGPVGFRSLEVERGADGELFGLIVNGVEVFAAAPVGLHSTSPALTPTPPCTAPLLSA
jgi:beta-mannosidase